MVLLSIVQKGEDTPQYQGLPPLMNKGFLSQKKCRFYDLHFCFSPKNVNTLNLYP